jgi:hypothetical protein
MRWVGHTGCVGKAEKFLKPQIRIYLEHLILHKRTKLKWIIEKYIMEIGTELNSSFIAASGRIL